MTTTVSESTRDHPPIAAAPARSSAGLERTACDAFARGRRSLGRVTASRCAGGRLAPRSCPFRPFSFATVTADGPAAASPSPSTGVDSVRRARRRTAEESSRRPSIPGRPLGEWDFQMLGLGAHVGALVLEIERGRAPTIPRRAGAGPAAPRRCRAAHRLDTEPCELCDRRSNASRRTDFTVLLEGESGVGKELVARQIHELSRRRNGPFVAINCAALVETLLEAELFGIEERTATGVRGRRGKFEHADGGTLFLDEVSDLSLSAQAKLLRAIQDLAVERVGGNGAHRVDIRIVAATNRQSGSTGRAAALSAGPLLPAERRRRPGADAARAARGRARAGAATSSSATGRRAVCACRPPPPTRWSPTTGRATSASSNG